LDFSSCSYFRSLFYQRISGPTYPLSIKGIPGDNEYSAKLIRSATIGETCDIDIDESELFDQAYVIYSKYPGEFENDTIKMKNLGGYWNAYLPEQPSAGKLKYHIVLIKDGDVVWQNDNGAEILSTFKHKNYIVIGDSQGIITKMIIN